MDRTPLCVHCLCVQRASRSSPEASASMTDITRESFMLFRRHDGVCATQNKNRNKDGMGSSAIMVCLGVTEKPAETAVCLQVGSAALPSVAPSASSASSTSGTGLSTAMPTPTVSATAARRSRFGGSSSMENLAALDTTAAAAQATRDKRFSLFNSCKLLGCIAQGYSHHLQIGGILRLHQALSVAHFVVHRELCLHVSLGSVYVLPALRFC